VFCSILGCIRANCLCYRLRRALWEEQEWLLKGFNTLTAAMGRAVAGTFGTTKGEGAIRAADIPPARPALDRRRERLLTSVLSAPAGTPKRALLPPSPGDDSSRRRVPPWFLAATGNGNLVKEGQIVEESSPRPRLPTLWARPANLDQERTCHTWTDGSYRRTAGLGWCITTDEEGHNVIASGARSLGAKQTFATWSSTPIQPVRLRDPSTQELGRDKPKQ